MRARFRSIGEATKNGHTLMPASITVDAVVVTTPTQQCWRTPTVG